MEGLYTDHLVIHVDRSAPACLKLDWLGRSTSGNPGKILAPFFEQLLAEASRSARRVEMHFEALEYFNSSMISALIHLIHSARAAKVALRIHYDAALRWQALSFDAIERAVQSLGQIDGSIVEFSAAS